MIMWNIGYQLKELQEIFQFAVRWNCL